MAAWGCQSQVQISLRINKCSYRSVVSSVGWDFLLRGNKSFPTKYIVEDQESFIVSLENTACFSKTQFLQRCNPDAEGARPVPLSEHIIRKLGPIFYRRSEGTLKTGDRQYSVTFQADSKIPPDDREILQKLLKNASIAGPDLDDVRDHQWNENQLIGLIDSNEDRFVFIHEIFWDFNPYNSTWEKWKPKEDKNVDDYKPEVSEIMKLVEPIIIDKKSPKKTRRSSV